MRWCAPNYTKKAGVKQIFAKQNRLLVTLSNPGPTHCYSLEGTQATGVRVQTRTYRVGQDLAVLGLWVVWMVNAGESLLAGWACP